MLSRDLLNQSEQLFGHHRDRELSPSDHNKKLRDENILSKEGEMHQTV